MESYITRKCLLSLVEKPGISIKLACSYKMHIVNEMALDSFVKDVKMKHGYLLFELDLELISSQV